MGKREPVSLTAICYTTPAENLRSLASGAERMAGEMTTEVPTGGKLLCERIAWIAFNARLRQAATRLRDVAGILDRVEPTDFTSCWKIAE